MVNEIKITRPRKIDADEPPVEDLVYAWTKLISKMNKSEY